MSRRLTIGLLLVLAIALVACGGGDEPEESGQPADETGGSAVEQATATDEPPTATPVEPTPTPEPPPTPTLAPTLTEIVEDAQPDGDQSLTESAGVSAGSGWGASGSAAQTACDHPYLPMRQGATWTYEGADGALTWEVVDVQGDMDEATAVVQVTVGDVTLDYEWQCATGKGLSSFDFASLASPPAGLELTIEQVNIDGQFLLPPDQLVPGANWTTELESKIAFMQEMEGTSLEATGDMITVQEQTILGVDPVELDGQSIPGLQLEQVTTMTMMLSVMGTAMEQVMTMSGDLDLAYGIGIVNQRSTTDFGTEEMTLTDYSIP